MSEYLSHLGDLFRAGGPVMWPLMFLSIVSVAMSAERAFYWFRQHRPGRRAWLQKLTLFVRDRRLDEARKLIAKDNTVYSRAMRALFGDEAGKHPNISVLIENCAHECERFSAAQSTIVTAAPLIGILGTVLGIINSFDLLSGESVSDISAVAEGIAQALITTAVGLSVALITLFPYMAFRAHSQRCLGAIEALADASGVEAARAVRFTIDPEDRPGG